MRLLSQLLAPVVTAQAEFDDERLWGGAGALSAAGVQVSQDTALRFGAVFACLRVISDPIGAVPCIVYRRQDDDGRRRAREYRLYPVLHSQPNNWQTALEWRKEMTVHALGRGEGLSRILPGPRGRVDRLVPIHPDRIESVTQASDYSLRYKVRKPDGTTETLLQDEVFHLRGLTLDGIRGVSVVDYAREAIGAGLAAEQYAARYYSQNGVPPAVLLHKGRPSSKARRAIENEWEGKASGLGNAHRAIVLAEEMDVKTLALSNEASQFIQTRQFSVEEIARWFGVPLHMIQSQTKDTSWGSGIEQMWLGFITTTLLFWSQAWEQTIQRDLVEEDEREEYYAELLLDALARGTLAERYQGYHLAITDGWMNRNEVRELENRNRVDGLDAYLTPANMLTTNDERRRTEDAPASSQPGSTEGRYRRLLGAVASRVLSRERIALQRVTKRCGEDLAAWQAAVGQFYDDHAYYLAEALQMDEEAAARYVDAQRAALVQAGPAGLDEWVRQSWAETRGRELVRLAVG